MLPPSYLISFELTVGMTKRTKITCFALIYSKVKLWFDNVLLQLLYG